MSYRKIWARAIRTKVNSWPQTHGSVLLGNLDLAIILQISAFYFPTFGKADCTIFTLSVGRSAECDILVLILVSRPFWSQKGSRDQSPYSVTFWSQNGLHTGLETILVSKTVSRSGLVTQCVRVISIYAHACTPAWAGI